MTEDMANFKILLTPWHGTPIAPPYIDSTFTEEIKSKILITILFIATIGLTIHP